MEELRSLEDLLDLQTEDSAIDRLLDRRQRLPELTSYRSAHERLTDLEKQRADVTIRIREAERGVDKASGELEISEVKLVQEERRLYAGGLPARDTEHLRQEVESIRRRISDREDDVIELMEIKEVAEGEGAALDEQIAAVAAEKAGLEATIAAAWKEIDAEMAHHEERKAKIMPLIPDELMDLYDDLRKLKDDGVGAARLSEGVCSGCHLRLSAAEQGDAFRESPPRCIHCRRILVR